MKPAAMGQAEALSRNIAAELACARTMIGGGARSTVVAGVTVVGGKAYIGASYEFTTPHERAELLTALRQLIDQIDADTAGFR